MSRSQTNYHITSLIVVVMATSLCCLSMPIGGNEMIDVATGQRAPGSDVSYDALINLLTKARDFTPEAYKLRDINNGQTTDNQHQLNHIVSGYDTLPSGGSPYSSGSLIQKRKVPTISLGIPLRLTADYMRDLARRRDYNEKYFKALTSLAEIGK